MARTTDRNDHQGDSSEDSPDVTLADSCGAGNAEGIGPAALFGMAIGQPDGLGEGSQVGLYKLLQKLGEGGFGEVWEAIQRQPVKRYVALKVLKIGMDSKEFLARFEMEIRALEKMNHPGIAKILDAGMAANGRPYFVMELFRGIPVTEYCRSHKIGTRERLELFAEICTAVQHAHQKAVIHRDLKPSNILVAADETGKPRAKIIDFGLAKALDQPLTEQTLRTRIDQFLGTPAYMSPEQAGQGPLDVDTRSDVYSLGVLLYELLSGVTPFDAETMSKRGLPELQRLIREKEPPRLSSRIGDLGEEESAALEHSQGVEIRRLRRAVRRDLDWIVMKALEKEPARRYESASALGKDVERYLNQEPVEAAAPSPVYRIGKFVRRKRGPLTAAGLILLAGVYGVWQTFRAQDSARDVQESDKKKNEALEEKGMALKEKDIALAIVSREQKQRTEAEQISAFLGTMLIDLPAKSDKHVIRVVEVVDHAVVVVQSFEDRPRFQSKLYSRLSDFYGAMGLKQDAAELLLRIQLSELTPEEQEHITSARASRHTEPNRLNR